MTEVNDLTRLYAEPDSFGGDTTFGCSLAHFQSALDNLLPNDLSWSGCGLIGTCNSEDRLSTREREGQELDLLVGLIVDVDIDVASLASHPGFAVQTGLQADDAVRSSKERFADTCYERLRSWRK